MVVHTTPSIASASGLLSAPEAGASPPKMTSGVGAPPEISEIATGILDGANSTGRRGPVTYLPASCCDLRRCASFSHVWKQLEKNGQEEEEDDEEDEEKEKKKIAL